jgi:hypothetical protein
VRPACGTASSPPPTASPNDPITERAAISSPPTIISGEKAALKNHSPKYQMRFNIHIPNQDHRDRGKRLRLPSNLLIENASDQVQRLTPKLVSEAFPIKANGNTATMFRSVELTSDQ